MCFSAPPGDLCRRKVEDYVHRTNLQQIDYGHFLMKLIALKFEVEVSTLFIVSTLSWFLSSYS